MPPLIDAIDPGAGLLAPRGPLPWEGGFAFFRRHEDRRIDFDDLERRCSRLADAIAAERIEHGHAGPLALIGFSNGATMGAALMLSGLVAPRIAILFRPMMPGPVRVAAEVSADVLVLDAAHDVRRNAGDAIAISSALRQRGALLCHL
ncbi:MAG: esterase, partial [Pseudomonadota bacterium]